MKRFRDYNLSEQRDVQKMNLSDIKKYVGTRRRGHSRPMGEFDVVDGKPVVYPAMRDAQYPMGVTDITSVQPKSLRSMDKGLYKRATQLLNKESVDRRQEPDAANIGTEKLQRRKLIQKRLEKEFPTTKTGNVGLIHGIVQQRQLLGHLSGDKPLYTFAESLGAPMKQKRAERVMKIYRKRLSSKSRDGRSFDTADFDKAFRSSQIRKGKGPKIRIPTSPEGGAKNPENIRTFLGADRPSTPEQGEEGVIGSIRANIRAEMKRRSNQ